MTDKRPHQARIWERGVGRVVGIGSPERFGGICVDVVTPEGHTIQLRFSEHNEVMVRGWLVGDQYENGGDNRQVFNVQAFLPRQDSIVREPSEKGSYE